MGMSALVFLMSSVMGGQGSELLNYVQTEAYWQARDERIVDVTTMSAVLADKEDRPPSDKLMAIRALGELGKAEDGDKQAVLKVLEPLVDSNEPFVGHYARRSIAWVKGDDPPMYAQPTAEALSLDLALLPKSSQIVAQMKMTGASDIIDIGTLIPDFGAAAGPQGAEMKKQMLAEANKAIIEATMMLGNVRIDALSLGVNFTEENGDDGYAALVIRGQYDRIGAQLGIEELAKKEGEEVKMYSIGEVEVIAPDVDEFALLMPSDEVLVLLFGEPSDDDPLPIESTAKAFANKDRKPAFEGEVAKQLEKIDRDKAAIWMAMHPSGPIASEMGELFDGIKAGYATATPNEDGGYSVAWVAEGKDAAKLAETVVFITDGLEQSKNEMKQMIGQAPQMKTMFEPMLKMMESIKVKQDGNTMTGEMTLDPANMMSPFMMFGAVGGF